VCWSVGGKPLLTQQWHTGPAPNRTPSGYLMDDGPGLSPVELPAIEE
jgi:hypothetical protein